MHRPTSPGVENELAARVLKVRTVEGARVEEDRDGLVKGHAVLGRVGLSLSRVPLEHLFSIYAILLGDGMACAILVNNVQVQRHRVDVCPVRCGVNKRQRASVDGIGEIRAGVDTPECVLGARAGQPYGFPGVPPERAYSVPMHRDRVFTEHISILDEPMLLRKRRRVGMANDPIHALIAAGHEIAALRASVVAPVARLRLGGPTEGRRAPRAGLNPL